MDYTAKPGDVIVFNEKGLREAHHQKNDRIVLRYHFRKKFE